MTSKGNVKQVYGRKYKVPSEDPLSHIEFSLKYDDLSLDFLKAVFEKILTSEIETFITSAPGSKYSRKIGFLYEFLTGKKITLLRAVGGNYADLLEDDKYVTGRSVKDARWRINNNLLGAPRFCPLVRKTRELNDLLLQNIEDKIKDLKESYPQDIFRPLFSEFYSYLSYAARSGR